MSAAETLNDIKALLEKINTGINKPPPQVTQPRQSFWKHIGNMGSSLESIGKANVRDPFKGSRDIYQGFRSAGSSLSSAFNALKGGSGAAGGTGAAAGAAGAAGGSGAAAGAAGAAAGPAGAAAAAAGAGGGGGGPTGADVAGMAGPGAAIAAAVAVGVALVKLPAAIHEFASSLLDSQKHLANFSGAMANVFARKEVFDTFHQQRMGNATAGSTGTLEAAYENLTEALEPMTAAITNIWNSAGSILTNMMAAIMKLMNILIGPMFKLLDKLMGYLAKIVEYLFGKEKNEELPDATAWMNNWARQAAALPRPAGLNVR